MNGEVVDYSFDTSDLGGVGGGERAGGFAADCASEGGDLLLNRGLDGLAADSTVTCDAALEGGGEAGVISGRWRRTLAASEGKDQS